MKNITFENYNHENVPDGIYYPSGRGFPGYLGFTNDLFEGYIWKDKDRIIISFIMSKYPGKGNLSKLFDRIESCGFRVAVPTPLYPMNEILKKKGFKKHYEYSEEMDCKVEMWEKKK